jgi:hypothetical protein
MSQQKRINNGKMESIKRWKAKILGSGRDHSNRSRSRLGYWLVVIAGCACTVGCTTLKKAAIVSSLGTTGALVGNAVSGTAGLVVGGLTTAAVADVATEVMIGSTSSSAMNNCAPDNFWSLLGSLIELGGWALILIVIVPMVFSWLMPGPIQFKGRKKK